MARSQSSASSYVGKRTRTNKIKRENPLEQTRNHGIEQKKKKIGHRPRKSNPSLVSSQNNTRKSLEKDTRNIQASLKSNINSGEESHATDGSNFNDNYRSYREDDVEKDRLDYLRRKSIQEQYDAHPDSQQFAQTVPSFHYGNLNDDHEAESARSVNSDSEDESETSENKKMNEDELQYEKHSSGKDGCNVIHAETPGSVAFSSVTHSDGSLNLSNLPNEMDKKDLVRLVQKLTQQNMKLKTKEKNEKNEVSYNPLVVTTVKTVVKHNLFPKVQFIRHDDLFNDFRHGLSIGKFVMDRCNIETDEEKRTVFWGTYKPVVRKQVKIQRNIVHNALKKKFFGK